MRQRGWVFGIANCTSCFARFVKKSFVFCQTCCKKSLRWICCPKTLRLPVARPIYKKQSRVQPLSSGGVGIKNYKAQKNVIVLKRSVSFSSLNLFSKRRILVTNHIWFVEKTLFVTSSNATLVEFVANLFKVDSQSTEVKVKTTIEQSANSTAKSETSGRDGFSASIGWNKVVIINSTLNSISFNCRVSINNKVFHTSINLYEQCAFYWNRVVPHPGLCIIRFRYIGLKFSNSHQF